MVIQYQKLIKISPQITKKPLTDLIGGFSSDYLLND